MSKSKLLTFLLIFLSFSAIFSFYHFDSVSAQGVTWSYNADTNTATASGAGSTNFAELVASDTAGGWGKFTSDATGTQIQIAGKIVIGDGTNTCAFSDTAKQIFINITGLGTPAIKVNDYSTLTLGTLINRTLKTTKSGCAFYITMDYYGNGLIQGTNTATKGASIYLYGCLFLGATEDGTYFSPEAVVWGGLNVKIYDCTASYVRNLGRSLPITADLSRNTISFSEKIGESRLGTTTDTKIASCISIWVFSYATSVTVKNLYSYNCTNGFYVYESTVNHYLIDVTPDVWKFTFSDGYMNTKVFRQYTFNLNVLNGEFTNFVEGATVQLWKDSALVYEGPTNSSGMIPTQTLTLGYYQQSTGNTIQNATSPYYLVITHPDWQTYVSRFYITEPLRLTVSMQEPTYTGYTEAEKSDCTTIILFVISLILCIIGLSLTVPLLPLIALTVSVINVLLLTEISVFNILLIILNIIFTVITIVRVKTKNN